MDKLMTRYIIKEIQKNSSNYRIWVGIWVFTVQFFQLLCKLEIFHHKMLGGNIYIFLKIPFQNVSQAFLLKPLQC